MMNPVETSLNVLLVPIGSSGDVNPFVALGKALQARGHRVTMITNGHFEGLARRSGFEFEPLGTAEEYDAILDHRGVWEPVEGFRAVARWAILKPLRRVFEIIEARHVPGETVVAAPVTAFGARVAQEALGVPLVSVALQPAMFRSLVQTSNLDTLPLNDRLPAWNRFLYWLSDVAVVDRLLGSEVNAFRAELGLPPVRRFFNGWWFSPERIVGLFPDWFAPPPPDWPAQLRLTSFPLYDAGGATPNPPDVEEFLGAGEPPVVFTPGSAMKHGREFFEAAVDSLRRLGRRGVLVTRFRDQVPPALPAEVRAFDFVPFSRLFPRATAVVHHGGIGTSAQALAAGVPQLVMPMAHDQHDNTARLERLGVARSLRPRRFRGRAVAEAIDALLRSHTVAGRCRAAAERLKAVDPLPDVCRWIERTAEGRPRPLVPS
jgi:UDP:flavonoid glycosyltransferase YjiC (YdhE family)